jgi:hypothetical protein
MVLFWRAPCAGRYNGGSCPAIETWDIEAGLEFGLARNCMIPAFGLLRNWGVPAHPGGLQRQYAALAGMRTVIGCPASVRTQRWRGSPCVRATRSRASRGTGLLGG